MATPSIDDIDIKVHSNLTLALEVVRKRFGDDYKIQKQSQEEFFLNVSIKEIECSLKCFIPLKRYEEKNELETEFHVKGDPASCKSTKNTDLQLKGGVEANLPSILTKFWKMGMDANGLVHKKASEEWSSNSQPIPPGATLYREKGYAVYVCKVEVSLRVPSLKVCFYEVNLFKKNYEKTVSASTVLSKLQGYDKSTRKALVEIEYKVEAEHHKICKIEPE